MIDEEKVALMTKLAIYEKHEEKKDIPLTRFYEEDYVKLGCLRTILSSTFGYFLFVGTYIYMHNEELLANINDLDYFAIARSLITGYLVTLLVFFVFAFFVYTFRFHNARKGLMEYNQNLKKLLRLYEGKRSSKGKNTRRRRKKKAPEPAVKVNENIGGDIPDLD